MLRSVVTATKDTDRPKTEQQEKSIENPDERQKLIKKVELSGGTDATGKNVKDAKM